MITVPVRYNGILPDMFATDRDVIVEGKVENGVFHAKTLLTLPVQVRVRPVQGERRGSRGGGPARSPRAGGGRRSSMSEIGRLGSSRLRRRSVGVLASVLGALRRDERLIASGKRRVRLLGADRHRGRRPAHFAAAARLQRRVRRLVPSSTLPTWYTIAALWGGNEGLAALVGFILAVCNAVVQVQNRDKNRDQMPWVTAHHADGRRVLPRPAGVHITDPFERAAVHAARGLGPEPAAAELLDDDPSAVALHRLRLDDGAVRVRDGGARHRQPLGDAWIRTTRRWALFSWFFLSLGNLFGAAWAYVVLGWGGYWAGDPVENAAFMPRLTATAYLHSVMIQEKKDMLKVWNMALVILTFGLTIFGTFLTRSGVISSVHSFTQSGMGPFMGFLLVILTIAIGLLIWRLPLLKSRNELSRSSHARGDFLLEQPDPGRHRVHPSSGAPSSRCPEWVAAASRSRSDRRSSTRSTRRWAWLWSS